MPVNINWFSDKAAEKLMTSVGLTWSVARVKLSDIDWDDSKSNGARLHDPLNDELAKDYSLAMERGEHFPMIVLLKRKGRKYLILGGNHRACAVKMCRTDDVECYVVETEDVQIIDILPRALNRTHGLRQDRSELLINAIYAVEKYGWGVRQADEFFGLPEGAVSHEMRARTVKATLQGKGIRAEKIPKTTLLALSPLESNENVLLAAARIVSGTGMVGSDVRDFVKCIKKNRTEASQMSVIADMESRSGPHQSIASQDPAIKVPRQKRTKFLAWITTGENYLDGIKNLKQLQVTEKTESDRIRQRLSNLRERIDLIVGPFNAQADKAFARRHS